MGQISKFFKSLSISFTKSEIEFVRKYLNTQEQILFYRMPVVDQKHAIEIAQILESRAKDQTGINTKELIQAGLLHDLGKCFYPFSLRDRVLGSLLRQFLPPAYESLASKGEKQHRNTLSRMLYVHKHHPKLGADLARETGMGEPCCVMIEQHQSQDYANPSAELKLLWEVDNEA